MTSERPPLAAAIALQAALTGAALGGLYAYGITVEVMQANGWWTPFLVVQGGLLAGSFAGAFLDRRPNEGALILAEGRREDLADSHATVIQQLRNLDAERDKLDPADYDAERANLLAVGAAALRELAEGRPADDAPAAPDLTATLRELRAKHPAAFDAALEQLGVRTAGVSGEWRGAVYTLAAIAVGALLWSNAQDGSRARAPGGTMTGGDGAGMAEEAPPQAPDPQETALRNKLAQTPDDVDTWNQLTEHGLSRQNLQLAMEANSKAMELAPKHPDVRTYRAILQAFVGRRDEALQALQAVAADHPGHANAWVYQGLLQLETNPAAAATALEKAASLDPSPQIAAALAEARRRAAGGATAPPIASAPADAAPSADAKVLARGTITLGKADATGQVLFVNLKDPAGGPPLAAVRLPPGPFPQTFQITTDNVIRMGGDRPIPAKVLLTASLDGDGNAMSKEDVTAQAQIADLQPGDAELTIDLR